MVDKLKVFLSSAQYADEFATEREALPTLFEKEPLKSTCELWRIEDLASPNPIDRHFAENVRTSDILLLLLGNTYRKPVNDEFDEAVRHKKNIYAFIRGTTARSREMKEFIDKVRNVATTTNYDKYSELARKIEDSFLASFTARAKSPSSHVSSAVIDSFTVSERERTLRILVGILESDSSTVSKARSHVIDGFVAEALLTASSPLTAREIRLHIDRTVATTNLTESMILTSLERLKQRGSCVVNGHLFGITEQFRQSVMIATRAHEEKTRSLLNRIWLSVKTKIDNCDLDVFSKVIHSVVAAIIYKTAMTASASFSNGDTDESPFDSEELHRLVTFALDSVLRQADSRSAWHSVAVDVLGSDDADLILWIRRLWKAYWSLALMGFDPACTKHHQESISRHKIYLDSHVIIRALVGAGSDAIICQQIVRRGQKLGVRMSVYGEIYREVETAFSAANNAYYAADQSVSRAISIHKKLGKRSDIFDGFLSAQSNNSHITWDDYLNRFYSVYNRTKLVDTLRHELGVDVEEQKDFSPEERNRIDEVTSLLLQARGHSATLNLADWSRYRQLRENEAKQMAVIYEERRHHPDSYIWFVTFDEYVYRSSIRMMMSREPLYSVPCFIKPAIWIEILTTAGDEPLDFNIFRQIMTSDTLQRVADRLENEVISQMLRARVDEQIKNVEQLENMFADIVNRPAIRDAYNELRQSRGTDRVRAGEKVTEHIIFELNNEVARLHKTIDELKESKAAADNTAEKERSKARFYKRQAGSAKPPGQGKGKRRGKKGRR